MVKMFYVTEIMALYTDLRYPHPCSVEDAKEVVTKEMKEIAKMLRRFVPLHAVERADGDYCPICGTFVDYNFCESCGQALKWKDEISEKDKELMEKIALLEGGYASFEMLSEKHGEEKADEIIFNAMKATTEFHLLDEGYINDADCNNCRSSVYFEDADDDDKYCTKCGQFVPNPYCED